MNPSTRSICDCISCNRSNNSFSAGNPQGRYVAQNCIGSSFCLYQTMPSYQSLQAQGNSQPHNFPQEQQQQNNNPLNSSPPSSSSNPTNMLLRRALSSGSTPVREVVPLNNQVTRNNENQLLPPASALLNEVSQDLSKAYQRINEHTNNTEKEMQDIRQRYDEIAAINEKLKKEMTQKKRERTIATKETEKIRKELEEEKQRHQESLNTINQLRDELNAQNARITIMEQNNKQVETKYNQLLSSQVDQKAENLRWKSERANLTDQVATLKIKISSLTHQRSNLLREKEEMGKTIKQQDLELKAEKFLKEQIIKEELDALAKPTLLNRILMQKADPKLMLSLPKKRGDEEDNRVMSGIEKILSLVAEKEAASQHGTVRSEGESRPALERRQYYNMLNEVKRLKEGICTEGTAGSKRKSREEKPSSTTVGKKAKIDQHDQASSEVAESDHGEDEGESAEDNDSNGENAEDNDSNGENAEDNDSNGENAEDNDTNGESAEDNDSNGESAEDNDSNVVMNDGEEENDAASQETDDLLGTLVHIMPTSVGASTQEDPAS